MIDTIKYKWMIPVIIGLGILQFIVYKIWE